MLLVSLPLDVSTCADYELESHLELLLATHHLLKPPVKSIIAYILTARILVHLFLLCGNALGNFGLIRLREYYLSFKQ